jgi:hypothetical protein
MLTFGVSNFVFSVGVGLLARHVVPEAVVGVATVLQLGLVVFLLVWIPDRQLAPVFFVISALWGLCDAIWQIQCNCKYLVKNIVPRWLWLHLRQNLRQYKISYSIFSHSTETVFV